MEAVNLSIKKPISNLIFAIFAHSNKLYSYGPFSRTSKKILKDKIVEINKRKIASLCEFFLDNNPPNKPVISEPVNGNSGTSK